MPIVVTARTAAALGPEATVVIAVRSPADPVVALRAAVARIARTAADGDGPKHVSSPVPVPGGAVLMVDLGTSDAGTRAAIPGILVDHLAEAGITEATVDVADRIGSRYATAESLGPAARAWIRWPLATRADSARPGWLWEATRRASAVRGDPATVIISVEIPLTWDDVPEVVGGALREGQPATVVAGDFTTSIAACALDHAYRLAPQAALTVAGPPTTDTATAMTSLRDALRSDPGTFAWAGIGATADARHFLIPQWMPDDALTPVDLLPETAVPDATWFQILSEGHLARLGGPPPGSRALDAGRVELTIGEPEQWLPDHPDHPALLARARRLLAPCLLDPAEAATLSRERIADAGADKWRDAQY